MAKNFAQYMAENENDAEAALKAAIADVGRRENQNSTARAFKRAYAPLVESLKLPVDVDTDSETEAQTLAARAAEQISNPAPATGGDEAALELIETLQDVLSIYEEHTGIVLGDVLDTLPENASDSDVESAVTAAFQPLTALQERAARADLQDAAAALGKPVDALADYLEGKQWGVQAVKAQDGTEAQVWGIGTGEAFKPLADLPGVQAIGAVTPQPKPTLPTTQKGGPAVQKSDADMRREKAENISHMI